MNHQSNNEQNNMNGGLTEDQRARIDENRRKALERRQQKSQQLGYAVSTATSTQSTSLPPKPPPNNQYGASPQTQTNTEQRARIEANRQKALERRQQSMMSSNITNATANSSAQWDEALARRQNNMLLSNTNTTQPTTAANISTVHCPSPTINAEQRARIEENRRKALEKRQQKSSTALLNTTNTSGTAVQNSGISNVQCSSPSVTMNAEQKARMEENRRKALEKRKLAAASAATTSSANVALPPTRSCQSPFGTYATDNIKCSARTTKGDVDMKMPSKDEVQHYAELSDILDNNNTADTQMKEPPSNNQPIQPNNEAPKARRKSGLPTLPPDLHYEESRVLPIYDDDHETLLENANLDEELLNGWSLYEHQKEGVRRGLNMRRLILAFDMGLGKTIIGCVWAKSFLKTFKGLKVFVIAPVSLREDWTRTATEATGLVLDTGDTKKKAKKRGKKAKKKKKKTKLDEKTVTGKRRRKAKKVESDIEDSDDDIEDDDGDDDESLSDNTSNNIDMYIYSWSKISDYKNVINDIDDYVVIADEAHSMQSMSSKRTEEALKLMGPKKCRGVLLLSGTPMKNGKPSNLFPLLNAVQHPFGDHQRKYEFFFCNGQQKTFRGVSQWDASGSSNLHELNSHTTSHIFRMTKEQALTELPPRKREMKRVPVSPRHEMKYTQALKDLAQSYSMSNGGDENDDILSLFNKIRQVSSLAKVDSVVAMANKIIIDEGSVVIFTNFLAPAKEIYEKLVDNMSWDGELLTGEVVAKKRQAIVDRFQSGLSPLFVCTYGAGGVGLTLTAACTVILVDRPWTPGDVSQAEDRIRRIGQTRPVRSMWIRAFPIDEQIDNLIDHKEETSNAAVDGKKGYGGGNKAAPKVSIALLVKGLLEPTSDAF